MKAAPWAEVDVHVEHGREVQVAAGPGQGLAYGRSGLLGGGEVVSGAKLGGRNRWRKTAIALETGDAAAFLVHGDEDGTLGQGLELPGKALELVWTDDVSPRFLEARVVVEEGDASDAAGGQVLADGILGRDLGSAKTDHDHLPAHTVQIIVSGEGRKGGQQDEQESGDRSHGGCLLYDAGSARHDDDHDVRMSAETVQVELVGQVRREEHRAGETFRNVPPDLVLVAEFQLAGAQPQQPVGLLSPRAFKARQCLVWRREAWTRLKMVSIN